jgi:NHL repeat
MNNQTNVLKFATLPLAVLLALGALALTAAPALGAQAHAYSFGFGDPGSEAGQLSLASNSGVAVNDQTGDVYVADTGNNRVDEFEANGKFVRAFGANVGGPGEETCMLICSPGSPGSAPGNLEAPVFIAVDNSSSASKGDVYVAVAGENLESSKNLVSKFTAEGKLIESWGVKGQLNGPEGQPEDQFGQPEGIAGDAAGTLWVYVGGTIKSLGPHMYEFDQESKFKGPGPSNNENSPPGIALDSSGHLYLSEQGAAVEKLPPNKRVFVGTNTGLAIAPASNELYVDGGSSIADISSQCEPSTNGCAPVQVFGEPQLKGAAGLAVDTAGTVYAANTTVDQVAVLPIVLEVNPNPGSTSSVTATTATLNGEVNPDGAPIGGCYFEYATSGEYGEGNSYSHTIPCEQTPAAIGEGTTPVPVHAKITGLLGGTIYHYRLVVKKAATVLPGNDETFATSTVPVVGAAEASGVTATGAELRATVNPEGVQVTRCAFEYGTSTEYGQLAKCEPAATQVGAGTEPVQVTVKITGLSPDTTYHWRLQARNANGEAISPDHTFVYDTTGAQLPDGRAYEMVTPPNKNGAAIGDCFICAVSHISRDGSRVIVLSIQCFAESPSCTGDRQNEGEPYEFTRTLTGWVTTPLAPPATQSAANTAWKVGADEGVALFSMSTGPAGEDEWFARSPAGTFVALGPSDPPGTIGIGDIFHVFPLSTRDLSHLVWEGESPFWPFDHTKNRSLYEYVGAHNEKPFLVGVKGSRGSNELISECETFQGSGSGGLSWNALSADGRTVYFTAVAKNIRCLSGEAPPVDELYARVDGEREDAHTVAISHPECGGDAGCEADEAHPSDAFFEGASEDGSRAFFMDTQRLTGQATQGAGDAAGEGCQTGSDCNLYLYDFALPEGERLIDASAGDTSGLGPRVQSVLATSADGSHVYFVADGVLTAAANAQGKSAEPGRFNLYVYERDASYPEGHTLFVTTLPAADSESVKRSYLRFANVTPDGRFLVFGSRGDLTSGDVRTNGAVQIFRYDARSQVLARVSVGDLGFNDNGNAGTGDAYIVSAIFGEGLGPARGDPTMSDDGSYIFFQSPIALTPHALDDVIVGHGNVTGEVIYAQNVYEWHEGRVYLISDGHDVGTGSNQACNGSSSVCLLGSDVTGHNVFFTSADQLVPSDTDTQVDVYDARVCEPANGNPCVQPVPPALPPCLGEACHGIPAGTPSALAPPSAFFNGEGNIAPTPSSRPVVGKKTVRCSAGKTLRHNRCVRRKHKAKRSRRAKRAKRAIDNRGGRS